MVKEQFIELIDKYLSGTATESEQLLLEEYITRLQAEENIALSEDQEQQIKEMMWQQIHLATKAPEVVQMAWYKKKIVRSIAVAASIILMIGVGVVFYTNKRPNDQSVAVQNDKQTDRINFIVQHEVNNTGKEKRLLLPDSSLIVLSSNSEISYTLPFITKRDITLKGKAFFKVAKDKTKPFTVMSGNVSTTALGTQFTVTAFEKASQITVRLFEGKVAIKAANINNVKSKDQVYLMPGEEFIYNNDGSFKVVKFKVKKSDVSTKNALSDNPSLPETKGSWYMFNNESLSGVLDQLAGMYNVNIVYNKKDIQNIYFTGRYDKTDSLGRILNELAILHNLKISRMNSAYTITR